MYAFAKKFPVKVDLSDFRLFAPVLYTFCCGIKVFSFAVSKYHVSCKGCSLWFLGDLKLPKFFLQNPFFFRLNGCLLKDCRPCFRFVKLFVSKLNFKCLAWHICLEFLFDKNKYHEKIQTVYIHVCLHTPLVSFCFTLCLQPSNKSVGGIFDRFFVFVFSKINLPYV